MPATQRQTKHSSLPAEVLPVSGVSGAPGGAGDHARYPRQTPIPAVLSEFVEQRTIGKDGKSYGRHRHSYNRSTEHGDASSLILDALRQCRYQARRADRIAVEHGLEKRDIEAMQELYANVAEIGNRWEIFEQSEPGNG